MRSDKHINDRRRVCRISLSGVLLAELRGLTLACWCPPKDWTSLTLADREVITDRYCSGSPQRPTRSLQADYKPGAITMPTTMAEERREESARKRALTRSVLEMVETAEACITSAGGIEIHSDRLPRGGWGTWMQRNSSTGEVDYSQQDEEAERVMARLLYRKLSQAVAEPGDVAYVVVVNTTSERAPEYHVPKMVTEVRGWSLHPRGDGGFSSLRLPPSHVADLSPRERYIRENLDEELGRLTGDSEEPNEEPRETFEEFMAEEEYDSFEEDARKLTYEEKLAQWEEQQRRLAEQVSGGGQYMPDDEVRYL